ncbi:MAG: DUF72 domain-containing protein [Polyangiales bacterium]
MRVFVGTSGFSYKEWKGSFYPAKLPQKQFLAHYARHLDTVEVNNTFYRFPDESVLKQWMADVPPGFRFALKASQAITHRAKLADCGEAIASFCARASVLGAQRGPVLVQLPPFLKKDVARLTEFLAVVPRTDRFAFEFRHASWFDDVTYDALRAHDAALCWAESEELVTPEVATASWGYLRLRTVRYDAAALARWGAAILAQPWNDAHVYFKHEDEGTGPRFAADLVALLGPTSRAPAT